jgi:hypothetical protein
MKQSPNFIVPVPAHFVNEVFFKKLNFSYNSSHLGTGTVSKENFIYSAQIKSG